MGVVEGRDEVVQWEATQGSNGGQEKIFVSVRVRPINSKESESNDFADWECINSTTILFKNCLSERSVYPNSYTFDRVFGFGSSTRQVYEEAAKEVALSVLNGVNSSVFAYGQTSSGKTYTMGGITQYAISDLYDYIYKHEEREYVVKFGAMEIYNEHVKDLLSTDPSPLRLLDDPEKGTVVEKLTEEIVRDKSHLLELIAVCEAQRQIGETSLNETSSRSHQILRLTVESTPRQLARGNSSMLTASVNFVDLAGSERTSQTQASGTRLKEGSHINRSLLTLGKCIRSLSKGRNGHVPYRDSKLTRILQNSLGGNARTAIICTMSPAHSHLEQSRNTLLFASCAKQVTTNAQVNVVMSDKALVKQLRKELARLERELTGVSLVSSKGDVVTVLKEKELQIEKMGKEMRELSRQRDYAQSRVEELLSSGERTLSSISQESGSRPQTSDSRRSLSWVDDSSLTSDASDYQRLDVEQLATSESLKFLQENEGFDLISHHRELLENFDDNLIPDVSSTQEVNQTAPNFARPSDGQSPRWEDITAVRKPDSEIEDKEVCCIEVKAPDRDTITEVPAPVKTFPQGEKKESFNDEDGKIEKEKEKGNEAKKEEEKESGNENTKPSEKKEEAKSVENEEYDALVKRIKELQMTIDCLVRRNTSGSMESDGSNPKRLRITRSMSCKATLASTKLMNYERLEDLPRVLDVNDDGKRRLTRLGNSMSMKNPSTNEVEKEVSETFDISISEAKINADAELEPDKPTELQVNGTIAEDVQEVKEEVKEEVKAEVKEEVREEVKKEVEEKVKEETRAEVKEEVTAEVKAEVKEEAEEETVDEPKESKSGENVANDSVTSTTMESQMSWEEEFESQRSKIIELWHACHIPLVHRTYFFLLFKGDASDKVYMDVELRRLSFIMNRFSKGQKIALDGQAFTQSSSMKALNQERDVLLKQVYKKIPSQERETLFRKWGIDMNSKQRRIQLARRIWTDPKDMEHIKESATLVARLIDFTDENQIPKEMFVGPSITPKTLNRRTYSWKTSMSSIA